MCHWIFLHDHIATILFYLVVRATSFLPFIDLHGLGRVAWSLARSNRFHISVLRILTIEQLCKGSGLIMPSPKASSSRSYITLKDAAAAQKRSVGGGDLCSFFRSRGLAVLHGRCATFN